MSSLCCEDEGNSNPVNNVPLPFYFQPLINAGSNLRHGSQGCSLKGLKRGLPTASTCCPIYIGAGIACNGAFHGWPRQSVASNNDCFGPIKTWKESLWRWWLAHTLLCLWAIGQNGNASSEIELMPGAVLTEGSELPWFKEKENINSVTVLNKVSVKCKELLADTLAPSTVHLQSARRSLGALAQELLGVWLKSCGGKSWVSILSHTRFTMSHTTQTQTLTLTSPVSYISRIHVEN